MCIRDSCDGGVEVDQSADDPGGGGPFEVPARSAGAAPWILGGAHVSKKQPWPVQGDPDVAGGVCVRDIPVFEPFLSRQRQVPGHDQWQLVIAALVICLLYTS